MFLEEDMNAMPADGMNNDDAAANTDETNEGGATTEPTTEGSDQE
jgi:hypothetical protein